MHDYLSLLMAHLTHFDEKREELLFCLNPKRERKEEIAKNTFPEKASERRKEPEATQNGLQEVYVSLLFE